MRIPYSNHSSTTAKLRIAEKFGDIVSSPNILAGLGCKLSCLSVCPSICLSVTGGVLSKGMVSGFLGFRLSTSSIPCYREIQIAATYANKDVYIGIFRRHYLHFVGCELERKRYVGHHALPEEQNNSRTVR